MMMSAVSGDSGIVVIVISVLTVVMRLWGVVTYT